MSRKTSLLQECNIMIEIWRDACDLYSEHPTEENKLEMEITLSLATEALKEKKLIEAEIEKRAMNAMSSNTNLKRSWNLTSSHR